MTPPALSFDHVTISYAGRPVLRDVSFAVAPGEAYGLVGESGCGKSTAALAALAALPRAGRLDEGRIATVGHDVASLAPRALRELRAGEVSMVYQDAGRALNPTLSVGRQVAECFALLGAPWPEASSRAIDALVGVRLPDPVAMMRRLPHTLSGGQQQRVVIAMALAKSPKLLVLDEPTTALDATVEAEILALLAELRASRRSATLLISHNLSVIARVCGRTGVLYAGSLVEEGPTGVLLAAPRHPYTAALLACRPRGTRHDGRLATIAGTPPPPGPLPPGCVYAPRCPLADDLCRLVAPLRTELGQGHATCCHHHERVGARQGAERESPLQGVAVGPANGTEASGTLPRRFDAAPSVGGAAGLAMETRPPGDPALAEPEARPIAQRSRLFRRRVPAGKDELVSPEVPRPAPADPQPGHSARDHVAPDTPASETSAQDTPASAILAHDALAQDAAASAILVATELARTHPGPVRSLRPLSLELARAQTLGIVGESGSGKTTLARLLVGLDAPDPGGTIRLDGDLLPPLARARSRSALKAVQLVFQNPDSALNRAHRVRRIVGQALLRPGGMRGPAVAVRLGELMRDMRMSDAQLDARPPQLSGGLKQRVAIARAFAAAPRVMVCDEPTSALDASVQAAILNLLADLQAEHGTALVLISHDLAVVRFLADRIAVLYLGRLMEVGPAAEVLGGPHHPYTAALVSAAFATPDRPATVLSGARPSPASPPGGCLFHTRCPRRIGPVCDTDEPPLHAVRDHAIRCHIPRDALGGAGAEDGSR